MAADVAPASCRQFNFPPDCRRDGGATELGADVGEDELDKKANGIATAEDFKRAWERGSEPVRLVLPKSGLPVLARRLSPLRVFMQSGRLAQLDVANGTNEERIEFAQIMLSTIQELLVEPKLSLTPGPREIDPNWLEQEDADFLFKWGLGVITAEGQDLTPLFRGSGAPPEPGPHGGDVRQPAEPDARAPGKSRPEA